MFGESDESAVIAVDKAGSDADRMKHELAVADAFASPLVDFDHK